MRDTRKGEDGLSLRYECDIFASIGLFFPKEKNSFFLAIIRLIFSPGEGYPGVCYFLISGYKFVQYVTL